MNELAESCGFTPRLCRPYRAKTKGKVERFNSYLKGSFVVPLASSLEASGLKLDVSVANRHVRRWLDEVANVRIHGTTGVTPPTAHVTGSIGDAGVPPASIAAPACRHKSSR